MTSRRKAARRLMHAADPLPYEAADQTAAVIESKLLTLRAELLQVDNGLRFDQRGGATPAATGGTTVVDIQSPMASTIPVERRPRLWLMASVVCAAILVGAVLTVIPSRDVPLNSPTHSPAVGQTVGTGQTDSAQSKSDMKPVETARANVSAAAGRARCELASVSILLTMIRIFDSTDGKSVGQRDDAALAALHSYAPTRSWRARLASIWTVYRSSIVAGGPSAVTGRLAALCAAP